MLRKCLIITVVLLMTCGGVLYAGESEGEAGIILPSDKVYDWGCFVEETLLDLSDVDLDKVEKMNEFAERRLKALENLPEEEYEEYVEELIEEVKEYEKSLVDELEMIEDGDIEAVMELTQKASERRGERLSEIAEDETMPEGAREGARTALENQAMAGEKAESAAERSVQARENRKQQELRGENTQEQREGVKPDIEPGNRDLPEEAEDASERGRDNTDNISEEDNNKLPPAEGPDEDKVDENPVDATPDIEPDPDPNLQREIPYDESLSR